MAELLAKFLQSPTDWKILPDFKSATPPETISSQDWSLRHELPLHLINFLRDEAEPLLSLSQSSGATPGKTNRPAKYDYNSPLKTVLESPNKQKPSHMYSNNPATKKSKKKVSLFPPKFTGRANKSFSDIEEHLDQRKNNGVQVMDGIGKLPSSPSKNKGSNNNRGNFMRKYQSASMMSVPENGDNHFHGFNRGFDDRKGETPTPINIKYNKKKQSLSPSTASLSLADFMAPIERRNGKKGKTPKSPSKIKSSTPIEDHTVARIANNIPVKVPTLDLDSADSFPEIGEPAAQKTRRMKPTLLSKSVNVGPVNPVFGQKVETNFSTANESPFNVEEVEKESFDRKEMVKEIATMLTPFKSSSASVKTPNKTPTLSRSNSIASTQLVIPSPQNVQKAEYLNLLANLYSNIFSHNLMPNFYVELYFVIELLLLDVPQESDTRKVDTSSEYFSSIHNCVYFSCQVLLQIAELLCFLDKTTIRLLMDNSRVNQFNPGLAEILGEVCDRNCVPSPLMMTRVNKSMNRGQENVSFLTVSFQSETDNRSNFPNNASFHDFKKQRDKFYSLIRKWGENMTVEGGNFEATFAIEVEKVMSMYQHPVNYYHFAKLWLAQLVAMCRGETGNMDQEDTHQLMAELRKTDPVKCKKLAARLITPGRCGGPCPLPSFSGAAEFFKDFLMVCNNPKFVRHLRDLLVSEVSRLDGVQFDQGETAGVSRLEDSLGLDSSDAGVYNEVLVDQFQETLITLRIFAKFLGFLESYPYQCDELSSDHVSCSVGVRDQVSPALDIAKCVVMAADQGRLVLTLPWVIEFLSQLDQAGHQLPYYNSLYIKLVTIYQTKLSPSTNSSQSSPFTAHFLSLYLGWLFEKKTFPREVMILALANSKDSGPGQFPVGTDQLDMLEVVTPCLVRQCCPWVGEIRILLQQWEGGKRGSQLSLDKSEGTYRKITPLAAPVDKKGKLDKESVMQSQLEENFFHNQPKSLRRTVEHVSERLAVAYIKKIRQIVIPNEKSLFTEALKDITKENVANEKLNSLVVSKVTLFAKESYEKVKTYAEEELSGKLIQDCQTALDLLLSFDTSGAAKETCVSISVRIVKEKVWKWVSTHSTLSYYNREYTFEAERVARLAVKGNTASLAPSALFSGDHDPDGVPPSELLITMKSHMKILLIDGGHVDLSPDTVSDVISSIVTCVQTRCDLTQLGLRALESLSLDWILTLMVKMPEVLTGDVVDSLLQLWSKMTPPQLVTILCPRNLVLLNTSTDSPATWRQLQYLLLRLIQSGLLPPLALEDSCLSLIRLSRLHSGMTPNLRMMNRTLLSLAEQLGRDDMQWVQIMTEQISLNERIDV